MAAKAVEWVWIMVYYTYYIATTCTSTCRWPYRPWESVEGGRVYEALLPKFDGVYKILLLHTSCRLYMF
jgi:hypothetical protein